MKGKVLGVVVVLAVVFALVFSISGCKSNPASPANTATTVPTVAATATATATIVVPVYAQGFETSVGGFLPDTGVTNAISSAAISTTKAIEGTHSIALTFQMVGGAQAAYVDKTIGGTANWVGKTISMKVWVPAAALVSTTQYAFEITIQAGTGWATYNSWVNSGIVADSWNTLTYVVPSNVDTLVGIWSLGFNIQEAGGTDMAAAAVLYIDDVKVQ